MGALYFSANALVIAISQDISITRLLLTSEDKECFLRRDVKQTVASFQTEAHATLQCSLTHSKGVLTIGTSDLYRD